MEIRFDATSVEITPSGGTNVDVIAQTKYENEILDCIPIDRVIQHYNIGDILNEIGVNEVKDHFGLIEPE